MRVDRHKLRVEFQGEEGSRLVVQYDNRGEPYREGIVLQLDQEGELSPYVFLETSEVKKLRDMLNELLPE